MLGSMSWNPRVLRTRFPFECECPPAAVMSAGDLDETNMRKFFWYLERQRAPIPLWAIHLGWPLTQSARCAFDRTGRATKSVVSAITDGSVGSRDGAGIQGWANDTITYSRASTRLWIEPCRR